VFIRHEHFSTIVVELVACPTDMTSTSDGEELYWFFTRSRDRTSHINRLFIALIRPCQ